MAGALEDSSEHPIAKAIATGARDKVGDLPGASEFKNLEGLGVQGIVDGHTVLVGRRRLLDLPDELAGAMQEAESEGKTPVAVGWDGKARGVLVVADAVKPTSAEAVRELRALGLTPIMLTGDNEAAARMIATQVGIDEVIAEVLPAGQGGDGQASAGRRSGGRDGRATASTTQPRSHKRISASRWAVAPTSRSRQVTSPWCVMTYVQSPTQSGCRARH